MPKKGFRPSNKNERKLMNKVDLEGMREDEGEKPGSPIVTKTKKESAVSRWIRMRNEKKGKK